MEHVGRRDDGLERVQRVGHLLARDDLDLVVEPWVAQGHGSQKAVELTLRQRIGAMVFEGIQRGNQEERLRQRIRRALHADLRLPHRFQKCGLGARRRPVQFISQDDVGEHGTSHKPQRAASAVIHHAAGDVGRQQVGRGLDPLEGPPDGSRHRAGQHCLAHSGHILQEQMTAGEQHRDGPFELRALAHNHALQVSGQGVDPARNQGYGRGRAVFRDTHGEMARATNSSIWPMNRCRENCTACRRIAAASNVIASAACTPALSASGV